MLPNPHKKLKKADKAFFAFFKSNFLLFLFILFKKYPHIYNNPNIYKPMYLEKRAVRKSI